MKEFRHSVWMTFRDFVLTAVVMAVSCAAAYGGRYELEKGTKREVCRAYEKNLNSLAPSIPMNCQRPINPRLKDFTKPSWSRIDPRTGVIPKIDDYLWKRDANPLYYVLQKDWSNWRGSKAQLIAAKRSYEANRDGRFLIGHLAGKVDIDNDGVPDNVYLDRACNAYGALLLVLNGDQTDIDYEKTKLVTRHRERTGRELQQLLSDSNGGAKAGDASMARRLPAEDALHHASYDVFQYKGVTFFDFWWIPGPSFRNGRPYVQYGPLRVFFIKGGRTREVCTFRFVSDE